MQKVTASEKCRLHEAFWHYSILAGMATLGLANRRLQPLGHSSMSADMPDAGASRKRQIQITPRPFRGAGAFRVFLTNGRYPVSRV